MFQYASILTPIFGWIISYLMFVPTLLVKNGRFGLECKSLVCRWISIDADNNPTKYDPEIYGQIMIILIGVLVVVFNLATYFQVSVTFEKKMEHV